MLKIGSPEWFAYQSSHLKPGRITVDLEALRLSFYQRFSPESLSKMDGDDLLDEVFGNADDNMIRLLMYDGSYRWFGAGGKYAYLGIIFHHKNDGEWAYFHNGYSESISREEAKIKATEIIRGLLFCTSKIEEIGMFYTSITDYARLEHEFAPVYFSTYPWVIKYFQMIYPHLFAGMYSDAVLDRALMILGLPNHGHGHRLLNVGEIALFERRCNLHNIVFNTVYDDKWTWYKDQPPCENSLENYQIALAGSPVINEDLSYYRIFDGDSHTNPIDKELVDSIEKDIESKNLNGADRKALIRVRVNQGLFREKLLQNHHRCRLCGVSDASLLVASHIKPWAVSESHEKLDPNNGFLLCPNHDKLFDQGLITFSNEGSIIISPLLHNNERIFMNVQEFMEIDLTNGNKKYLEYHRKYVFREHSTVLD